MGYIGYVYRQLFFLLVLDRVGKVSGTLSKKTVHVHGYWHQHGYIGSFLNCFSAVFIWIVTSDFFCAWPLLLTWLLSGLPLYFLGLSMVVDYLNYSLQLLQLTKILLVKLALCCLHVSAFFLILTLILRMFWCFAAIAFRPWPVTQLQYLNLEHYQL